ncbi:ABC transporter ATP-binding protein [Aliiroseovarius crassostreae]|uniref:ABC transporter ATP-binding protein n=1 Tax=Aliiroseovarius crassostreae TaxID=154981 RepID=UPI0021AFC6F9|nr:ATP-binding cassette domain-containing protein [Aliiroseovarius crassostreae]UWP88304.1 ATP-binding cassette domain-containing protein [Aliiroseovarius crassostreae]
MLRVRGLSKRFHGQEVLRDIHLDLAPREVVGLIGRSGAGKSTLARCMVGLEQPDAGSISLGGHKVAPGSGAARQKIQYLWQDPTQSLSPFLTAQGAVLETLDGFGIGDRRQRRSRAAALLEELGVQGEMQQRRPHALSGGQCQRVALARAIAARPEILILDEPLSSLDLVTQVNTIRLLRQLQGQNALSMLIVSHDLAPLRQLANRVLVLDEARIVEDIPMAGFATCARHPLSRAYADTLVRDAPAI